MQGTGSTRPAGAPKARQTTAPVGAVGTPGEAGQWGGRTGALPQAKKEGKPMRILAVDYGDARTGLAICDRGELLASPIGVFHSGDREAVIKEITRQVAEQKAELVVVGNPLNMNGTAGPRSELCHALADDLAEKLSCPVRMWDERSTTVTATQYLNMTDVRGKKRKNTIDAVAATIILESYLAYRKNHPGED